MPLQISNELPPLAIKGLQETLLSPAVQTTLYEIKNVAETVTEKSKQVFLELETNLESTPIDQCILRIREICTKTEKIFNILGCTPFMGYCSGSLRSTAGYLLVVTGVALAGIGEIGVFTNQWRHSSQEIEQKWKKVSLLGAELILHGCLNIIRGYGEMILSNYSFGLANVILLVPNIYKDDPFSPYFAYGALKI